MEIFELKYFLITAEFESVGKAATRLAVSPPAVSRAISRLEEELGVQLFQRVGRNIVLSPQGKQLQKEASRILGDLDNVKSHFRPKEFEYPISMTGTEFGLSAFLSETIKKLNHARVSFSLDVKVGNSSKAVERAVADGESQLGIISTSPSVEFRSTRLGVLKSGTYVGEDHPLYARAAKGKIIPIEEVLEHPFAGFLESFVFDVNSPGRSADGWREDKLPRKIGLRAQSIESALQAVESGVYLCYLPEAIAERRQVLPLKISDCPYECKTEVFLFARKSTDFGWMKTLFK